MGFGDAFGHWLGVFEDFAFVVPDDDAFVIVLEDVFGVYGDFASASWGVDDVLGDGVAGGVAAHGFHDFDAFTDGGSEV